MTKSTKKYILMPLVLMLSACSTTVDLVSKFNPAIKSFSVPYKEPEGKTDTRLRVVTNATVRLIPGRKCNDWQAPGGGMVASRVFALGNDKTHNDKTIGIPRDREITNSSEVYVKSNEPITIIYQLTEGVGAYQQYTCFNSAYFIPEENTDYEAVAMGSGRECRMSLAKITIDKTSNALAYTPIKLEKSEECKQ